MAGCVDARLAVGQFQVQGLALLDEASTEPRDWEINTRFHWTAWKQFPSELLRQLILWSGYKVFGTACANACCCCRTVDSSSGALIDELVECGESLD